MLNSFPVLGRLRFISPRGNRLPGKSPRNAEQPGSQPVSSDGHPPQLFRAEKPVLPGGKGKEIRHRNHNIDNIPFPFQKIKQGNSLKTFFYRKRTTSPQKSWRGHHAENELLYAGSHVRYARGLNGRIGDRRVRIPGRTGATAADGRCRGIKCPGCPGCVPVRNGVAASTTLGNCP